MGGLPLALELLGGYLAEPERGLFPELSQAAFAELADPHRRLQLASVRLGSTDGHAQTLDQTIRLSLEALAEVKPEAVDAFHALGAFAPKPADFDLDAALAVCGCPAQAIALLVSRCLLERDGDGRLQIHQTLADAARATMPAEAAARHRDHYLAMVESDREAWTTIAGIYPQIAYAWDRQREVDPSLDDLLAFVWPLRIYRTRLGLWQDQLAWVGSGLEIGPTGRTFGRCRYTAQQPGNCLRLAGRETGGAALLRGGAAVEAPGGRRVARRRRSTTWECLRLAGREAGGAAHYEEALP